MPLVCLTETSPMLTMNLPGTAVPNLASVGSALPGVDIRVAPPAETEAEVPAPTNGATPAEGEIQARGPGVFAGYRNLPAENAKAFTEDGWFRTGDLGHVDEEGHLYISGRASTLIVLEGGKKMSGCKAPEMLMGVFRQPPGLMKILSCELRYE